MMSTGTNTTARAGMLTLILVLCAAVQFCPWRAGEAALSSRPDPAKVQAAMRCAARSLGLQTQIPTNEDKPIAPKEYPQDSFIPRKDKFIPRMNGIPGAAGFLFYASLAAIAVVIFMTWRDNLWSSSRARRLERGSEIGGPGAEVSERMANAQFEADELAACDNFAEAMHTLLLRSVDELRRRLSVSIAASLTSREIQRRVGLPPEGRSAFADIIDRVEISYFGTHKPGPDDYAACRNSFDALTGVLRQYSGGNVKP